MYAKWSYKFYAKYQFLPDYTSPNNTDNTWTYVAFGDWPQTIKASEVTVDESKSKQMGMFTYYLGSDGNCYVKHNDDYYKVEPIIWRVLNKDYATTGKALLLAEKILTGGIPYYVDTATRTITGAGTIEEEPNTVYPNNYKYSTIRAWLNGLDVVKSDSENDSTYKDKGFLQTAFTPDAQKDIIADTMVDNTARSTNPNSNASKWNSGKNPYACENTKDKIFLLSVQEATTEEYGFGEYSASGQGNTRIRVTTGYAEATGAYQDRTTGYGGGCVRPAVSLSTSCTASTLTAMPTAATTSAAIVWALFRLCQFHFSERFSLRKIDSNPCVSNNLVFSGESGWSFYSSPPENAPGRRKYGNQKK